MASCSRESFGDPDEIDVRGCGEWPHVPGKVLAIPMKAASAAVGMASCSRESIGEPDESGVRGCGNGLMFQGKCWRTRRNRYPQLWERPRVPGEVLADPNEVVSRG